MGNSQLWMRDESFTFEHVKHFNLKLVNFMVGHLNDMGFYKKYV